MTQAKEAWKGVEAQNCNCNQKVVGMQFHCICPRVSLMRAVVQSSAGFFARGIVCRGVESVAASCLDDARSPLRAYTRSNMALIKVRYLADVASFKSLAVD